MKRSPKLQFLSDIHMFSVHFEILKAKVWNESQRPGTIVLILRALLDRGGKHLEMVREKYGFFFFQTVCHSHTKPSSLVSERIRAAKCHLWWIRPLMPGIFTHTAGLAVDGVFQCHARSVVVWYEKRLCEGRAGHLSTLTFHAKTFSSTWRLNSTLSS